MSATVSHHSDIESVLLPPEQIQEKIEALAQRISRDYKGRPLVLIGVLKGSVIFLADLLRRLTIPCMVDFISLSSYTGNASSGVVRMLLDLKEEITGKDVLVVEDIVDTGLTLSYLIENLKTRQPGSLEVCVLLDKKECRKVPLSAKYTGFEVPNRFVVGYGLDYNEAYRNLPYVGILKREVYEGSRI